ncbi:MAG: alpha/beta hydrolase [Bacteroidales bacterium]
MKATRLVLLLAACLLVLSGCSKFDDLRTGEPPGFAKVKVQSHGLDQERFATIPGIGLKVHYRIIGKGPVNMVFIPGWTNPLTVYSKQFDYFRNKARCIYIDLPGHGLSDAPEGVEYTQELMADAIYAVLKKEGVQKFIGVGFSWGHQPLTQLEIKHPGMITKLILLDIGITHWGTPYPNMNEATRNYLNEVYLNMGDDDKVAALGGLIPLATAPADLIEWGKYFLDYPNWLMANLYYHLLEESVCQPYAWDIPIMVVYRRIGTAIEYRTNLFFPGCEIHILDVPAPSQHVIQWAYHETLNPMMLEFIKSSYPGKVPFPYLSANTSENQHLYP